MVDGGKLLTTAREYLHKNTAKMMTSKVEYLEVAQHLHEMAYSILSESVPSLSVDIADDVRKFLDVAISFTESEIAKAKITHASDEIYKGYKILSECYRAEAMMSFHSNDLERHQLYAKKVMAILNQREFSS